jgi:Tfp pilus assembly protein PilN
MAKSRTSVEFHPDGCRLVDVEVRSPRARTSKDPRVRAYELSVEGSDPAELTDALTRLRRARKLSRDVWVTVWGLRAVHQLLRLPPAGSEALEPIARREARKDIAPLEADGTAASVAILPGDEIQAGAHRKREVSLVAASAVEIQQRIQPLIDAGFTVRGVVTPALALAAIARSTPIDGSGEAEFGTVAHVAVVRRAVCLAIVRNGVLLFAREMPWGHDSQEQGAGDGEPGTGTRLASELKRSILFFKQTFRAAVEAVVLCGDMPNLRSLTGPLGDALGVPVRTLDSLVGIDAESVPEPGELFRSEVASLRMAIATGADAAPAANLLPKAILDTRETRSQIVRFAAAAAAGLILVAAWYTVARQMAASYRDERQTIERELAILEPDAVRQADLQQTYAAATSRQAALAAFDSQGPRLARFLETLSASTPDDVTLNALSVQADGPYWQTTLRGLATSNDAAAAQGAVNALVDGLADSPFAGAPVQRPSRRVVSSRGGRGAAEAGANESRTSQIPSGMTGVEFSVQVRLAK